MSNEPTDHAREAERLIALAESCDWDADARQVAFAQTALACAQVHATLALRGDTP